jgi:hypothetical protein
MPPSSGFRDLKGSHSLEVGAGRSSTTFRRLVGGFWLFKALNQLTIAFLQARNALQFTFI